MSTFMRIITVVYVLGITHVWAGDSLLMKATPFFHQETTSAQAEGERVNLWPMFYMRRPYMSALWPMFVKNPEGNAVYPLYSWYYGKEFNVLWPLSSFDLAGVKGRRIVNTYWDTNSAAFFPLFFCDQEYWLAIPLAGYSWTNKWYSIVPPMWIHWYGDHEWFCAPLLAHWEGRVTGDYSFTSFPLFHQSRSNDTFKQNALFWLYSREKTPWETSLRALPLYYHSYSESDTNFHLFPLFHYHGEPRAGYMLAAPFFFKSWDKDRATLITPLYGTLTGTNVQRFVSPLFSFSRDADDRFLNILGFAYNHAWNESKGFNRIDVLWPMFMRKRAKDSVETLSPLLFYREDAHGYSFVSLVSAGRKRDEHFINALGFLFHHKWTENSSNTYTHIMWPFFAIKKGDKYQLYSFPLFCRTVKDARKSGYILFPFFSYRTKPRDYQRYTFFPFFSYSHCWKYRHYDRRHLTKGPPTERIATLTFPWLRTVKGTRYVEDETASIPVELRAEKTDCVDYNKARANTNSWQRFAARRWSAYPYRKCSFWPFWHYHSTAGYDKEWNALWLLYRYKWEAETNARPEEESSWSLLYSSKKHGQFKDSPATKRIRILWRWLMYEKAGDDVTMDVFPFITYDSKAKTDYSQFSVLWRLYRYKHEGGKRRLDLFFIPIEWGEGE